MASLCAVAAVLLVFAAPTEAVLLRAHVAGAAATGHPVADVIEMLQKLGTQVEEEGKAEELTFQKFEHWCARSKKELSETIAEEESTLESLAEFIDARTKTIDVLGKEIAALGVELGKIDAAALKASGERATGTGLYDAEVASLSGTIQALGDAIAALTTARTNTDPDLLQRHIGKFLALAGMRVSGTQRAQLESFIQTITSTTTPRPVLKAQGDDAAHVDKYAFKGDSVIELLKHLEIQFKAKLVKTHEEETNAINADGLSTAARDDLKKATSDSKLVKEGAKGDAEGEKSTAESEQTNTRNDLDSDKGTLGTTEQDCRQKAAEWSERSKIRSGEREAIETAVGVLAKVAGVRTTPPGNPVPPPSPVSFLQLALESPEVRQALKLLREEAKVSHSQAIAALAAAVAAKEDGPFDQVVNSIEKMIFHLMNEQKQEDDHKNWCDKEIAKTDASIVDKQDKIDELTTKIDLDKARASSLQNDIAAANAMVSKIVKHVKDATEIRKTGTEENTLAVKDAEAAQTALTSAISVLKTFYKGSGKVPKETWEFVQRNNAPVDLTPSPATWNGKYAGVANPLGNPGTGSEGILVVLTDLQADFSQMESDTLAQEENDQKAYEQDVSECKIEKARRTKEAEMKGQERKRVIERQTAMEATRKGVSQEKEATNQYLTDLQPACVDGDSSYGARKAARAKEITALKAAQDHLQDAFKTTAAPGGASTR